MTLINLDNNAVGKIVEKNILNANGQILLKSNTELTEQLVKILLNKGISKIHVLSSTEKNYSTSEIENIRNECRESLSRHFHAPASGTMMNALFDSVLEDMVARRING